MRAAAPTLERIAAALARPDGNAIDPLLRAMAGRDETFSRSASAHAGDIAVALDSINRWIGTAEQRFTTLSQTSIHNTRLLSRLVALQAAQPTGPDAASAGTAGAATLAPSGDDTVRLQAAMTPSQRVRVTSRLERLAEALGELDGKLSRLEGRMRPAVAKQPGDRIAAARSGAGATTSATGYFDLMSRQIEAFGEELRHLKKKRDTQAQIVAILTRLIDKIERLSDSHDRLSDIERRLAGAIEAQSQTGPQIEALAARLDEVGRSVASIGAGEASGPLQARIQALEARLQPPDRDAAVASVPVPSVPVPPVPVPSVPVPSVPLASPPAAPARPEGPLPSRPRMPSAAERLETAMHSLHQATLDQMEQQVANLRSHTAAAALSRPGAGTDIDASSIRSDFIAAARHAARAGRTPGDTGEVAEGQGETGLPNRFMRTADNGHS